MNNYRFTISYDGTRYHGWESKKEVDTIEGKLEAVFARMTVQEEPMQVCMRWAWLQTAS